MTVNLSEIPEAFHLPRPNWGAIRGWVDQHIAEPDRSDAWAEIATQWLGVLDEALGNRYRTDRNSQILLFAPRDYEHVGTLLDFAESGLAAIVDALGSLAGESWLGPLVILLFADADTYCLYTSPLDPDAVRSSGMCLRDGYVHIALRPYPIDTLQRTMLHEITHACLSHLSLPHWLEEGVAQLAEEAAIPKWARFSLDGEGAIELRRYWRERGLRDFWWGNGFFLLDEGLEQSYRLAKVLFRLLAADHRDRLPDFVRQAHADDAGDSAAREILGKSVAELAEQFLGEGRWEPTPPDGPSHYRRGILHLNRGLDERAIADFDEAIRLDPGFSDTHTSRGLARSRLGNFSAAKADYEQALEKNPKDYVAHNNLAWILATNPQDGHRDGQRALEHASKACELSGFALWFCVGTLAAASAEVGDFEEARTLARESLRLAPEDEKAGCKERLKRYKEGMPWREGGR